MIIHEENSETQSSSSPTKSSTLGLPTVGTERRDTSPAPPSYTIATSMTSSSAGPNSPLLPYQPGSSVRADMIHPTMMSQGYQNHINYALVEQERREINRRTRTRFCQALSIGALCYFLLMAFIGSTVSNSDIPWIDHGHRGLPPQFPPTPDSPNVPPPNPTDRDQPPGAPPPPWRPGPVPEDGEVIQCSGEDSWSPHPPTSPFITTNMNDITWSSGEKDDDLPYTGYNAFTLPVNVTSKTIFSKGRHASGSLILRTREADDEEDDIKIVIQASYRYQEALECKICTLKGQNGGVSLGIYTSRDFDGSKDIRFTIDVFFPKNRAFTSTPRHMGVFTAALSWFDITISTLNDIYFKSLTLTTESDKMHSDGVLADVLTMAGNNGDITGKFNITQEATIATTNAKIDVDLNVFHVEEKESKVTLSTNNAPIIARNSLYHSVEREDAAGGNFSIVASTKNAAIDVSFPVAPVDSLLNCVVGTSNGNTNVYLHPTYEGDVTLVTTNGQTMVHQADGIEDPSGLERERIVSWRHMWRWWWIGFVGWGEKKQAGSLVVNTSNGNNHLYL